MTSNKDASSLGCLIDSQHTSATHRDSGEPGTAEPSVQDILENVADGVIIIDELGQIHSFNSSAEGMFGHPAEEMIGKNVTVLMTDQDAKSHDGYLRAYKKTGIGRIIGIGPRALTGQRKDGSTFPMELTVGETFLNGIRLFIGSVRDVTRRNELEREAREKQEILETTLEYMDHGFCAFDADRKLVAFNQKYVDLYDFPPGFVHIGMGHEELVRHHAQEGLLGTEDCDIDEEIRLRLDNSKVKKRITKESTLPNGTHFVYSRRPLPDGGFVATFTDITQRRQAERKAAESSALFRAAVANMTQGFCIFDAERHLVNCNDKFIEMFDFPPGFLHPGISFEEISRFRAERGDFGEGDIGTLARETVARYNDPTQRTLERTLESGLVYLFHREPMPGGGWVQTYTDITERKRVERALQESEERFRRVFEKSGVGITIRSQRDRSLVTNEAFQRMLGYTGEELQSIHLKEITHPDDWKRNEPYRKNLLEGKMENRQVTKRYIHKNGKIVWLITDALAVRDADGTLIDTVNLFQDITESKQAQQEAAEQSDLLEATFHNMAQGIAVYDAEHTLGAFNSKYSEILGLPFDYLKVGMNRADIIRYRAEHGRYSDENVEGLVGEKLSKASQTEVAEPILPDGRSYSYQRTPIPNGGYIITVTDTTERKRAEEQLQQAQKMEAVGQLTGGIAHDFNNLLAVSLGNIELAEDAARHGGDVGPFLETVKRASERGASLTSQLLAFSRKQTLFPQTIDAGELMANMSNLLRSSLGETIEIKLAGDDDLWPCKVDPHQLEGAVLNLALNARDAMTSGGTLIIETINASLDDDYAAYQPDLEPGDYIQISVADTGIGMPKDVMDQVFDPFFTTKEVGEGSGLGLSMVYGFAKQSGGHVTIHSEEGKGTTIRLYLPRTKAADDYLGQERLTVVPKAHGETVLVVEDDPEVRALAVALLHSLGYETLEAVEGPSALKVLESSPKPDLLFTDVVLPSGMSGPKLAAEVRKRFPGMAVLYTSGYTDLANVDQSAFGGDTELLQKPYRKADLARKVRLVLDQSPS